MKAASARVKQARLRNYALGRCRCGKESIPAKRMCQTCIDTNKERNAAWRNNRYNAGLCICKEARPLVAGKRGCAECLKKRAKASGAVKKRRHGQPMTLKGFLGRLALLHRKHATRPFTHKGPVLLELWHQQGGICALSGLPMIPQFGHLESVSIDRKESSEGYEAENIQLVCKWANFGKNKYSDMEFRAILDKIRAQGVQT